MKTERKISTSIQLTSRQYEILEKIAGCQKQRISNAEILRTAFDFYVDNKYGYLK